MFANIKRKIAEKFLESWTLHPNNQQPITFLKLADNTKLIEERIDEKLATNYYWNKRT